MVATSIFGTLGAWHSCRDQHYNFGMNPVHAANLFGEASVCPFIRQARHLTYKTHENLTYLDMLHARLCFTIGYKN